MTEREIDQLIAYKLGALAETFEWGGLTVRSAVGDSALEITVVPDNGVPYWIIRSERHNQDESDA